MNGPTSKMTRRGLVKAGAIGVGAATIGVGLGDSVFAGSLGATGGPDSPAVLPGIVPAAISGLSIVPGTEMLTLSSKAFAIWDTATAPALFPFRVEVIAQSAGYTSTGFFSAPLPIPAGARIMQIDVFAVLSAAVTVNVDLIQTNLQAASSASTSLSTFSTTVGPGLVQATFAPPSPVTVGAGFAYDLTATTTSANYMIRGAVVQYIPRVAGLTAITPVRVYDSRFDVAGKIAQGQTRVISVANQIAQLGGAANVVPAGASALAYNVTLAETEGTLGYLSIYPQTLPVSFDQYGSAINWTATGASIANGLLVSLPANRQLNVSCGGLAGARTQFLIDAIGYFS